MKYYRSIPFITQKFAGLLFCGCFFFTSCLKNRDGTENGPKSLVAITNYVVNGSISIGLDNSTITTTPLGFGGGIATGVGGYAPLSSGLHNLRCSAGANLLVDKTISLASALRYSLFVYDTLQNNKVKTLLLTDDLTAIDTIGRARFLQFIPGADSLTLSLKKDALSFSKIDTYIGNKTGQINSVSFSLFLPPGNYQLTLERKGVAIFQQAGFTITAGKLYSFIAKGTTGGAGDYKETVKVVQHN